MKISPSLMCMDLLKFKEQIEFIDSHADYFRLSISWTAMKAESDALTVLRKPGKNWASKTARLPSDGNASAGLHCSTGTCGS